MDDSYESQNVVQAVNSPLKGLIVSFGSFTRGAGVWEESEAEQGGEVEGEPVGEQ